MITGWQIEKARKLLRWDRTFLGRRAGNLMTANAIRKAEQGDDTALTQEQLSAIERAFTAAGIEFTASGVPVLKTRLARTPKSLLIFAGWASWFAAKTTLPSNTWDLLLVI
jgi:hypothetical protein